MLLNLRSCCDLQIIRGQNTGDILDCLKRSGNTATNNMQIPKEVIRSLIAKRHRNWDLVLNHLELMFPGRMLLCQTIRGNISLLNLLIFPILFNYSLFQYFRGVHFCYTVGSHSFKLKYPANKKGFRSRILTPKTLDYKQFCLQKQRRSTFSG